MIEMKKCSGECGLEKELNKNNFQWPNKQGRFQNKCNVCLKKYQKEYRQEHKEEAKEYQEQYYQENKEKIKENTKEYYKENKIEIKKYKKEYFQKNKNDIISKSNHRRDLRKQKDPVYRLIGSISAQVRLMLKGKKTGRSTKYLIPFNEGQLKIHMEKWFAEVGNEWMHWKNYGAYNVKTWNPNGVEDKSTWKWQLDHITPVSHFDIKKPGDAEFMKCWDLNNLRPLSAKQNVEDGNRR